MLNMSSHWYDRGCAHPNYRFANIENEGYLVGPARSFNRERLEFCGLKVGTMTDNLEALVQVIKSPFHLVSAEVALIFALPMQPSKRSVAIDPPGWAHRHELWTIDELLGLYEPQQRRITIFTKGIEHVAGQLGVPTFSVEYLVRIHEYAHAVFHLGVDHSTSVALAKAFLDNDPSLERTTASGLTAVYSSVDTYVHEQIAQLITRLVLEELGAKASVEAAKITCAKLRETFEKLMRRQPPQYRIDNLQHLEPKQLKKRLRALIVLIRNADVRGTRQVWDTVMRW
jgi:hypothetical protein